VGGERFPVQRAASVVEQIRVVAVHVPDRLSHHRAGREAEAGQPLPLGEREQAGLIEREQDDGGMGHHGPQLLFAAMEPLLRSRLGVASRVEHRPERPQEQQANREGGDGGGAHPRLEAIQTLQRRVRRRALALRSPVDEAIHARRQGLDGVIIDAPGERAVARVHGGDEAPHSGVVGPV